jgi:hypothetical protein
MLVVCGLQHVAASAAALFEASSSTAFCLASASAAECIRYGSKKITYNCNYKCKQTAMLVLCELQPAAASAAALFEASSSATFCFCSSAFRFTSAIDFIIYCGKKSQVSILDKNSKKRTRIATVSATQLQKMLVKPLGYNLLLLSPSCLYFFFLCSSSNLFFSTSFILSSSNLFFSASAFFLCSSSAFFLASSASASLFEASSSSAFLLSSSVLFFSASA